MQITHFYVDEAHIKLKLIMSNTFDVVSNDWGIDKGLKVFRFFIVKLSFSFTNIKTITVPAICSVNTSSLL